MASKRYAVSDTPKLLKNWVENEMKMTPFSQKKGSHLYSELCRGQMEDVWEFVMQHVKSEKTVQRIRGNLKCKQLQDAQEKKEASVIALQQLKTKAVEAAAATDSVRRNIQQVRINIEAAEKLNYTLQRSVDNKLQKQRHIKGFLVESELLECVYKSTNQKLQLLADNTRKLIGQQDSCVEQIYITKETIGEDGLATLTLETICTSNVNECISSIHKYLFRIVNGDFNFGTLFLENQKRKLQPVIVKCQTNNSVRDVHDSVVNYMQESVQRLKNQELPSSDGVHYKRPAVAPDPTDEHHLGPEKDLRFQALMFRELKLQLLGGRHAKEVSDLDARLRSLQNCICNLLVEMFQDEDIYNLARELVDVQLNVASVEARFQFIKDLLAKMKEELKEAITLEHNLYQKRMQIHEIDENLEKKKHTVKLLMEHSASLQNKFENQQAENKRFVGQNMRKVIEEIGKSYDTLHGVIAVEVEVYGQIPAGTLGVVEANNGRTLEQCLGIHEGNRFRRDQEKLYRSLGCESYEAPDNAVLHFLKFVQDAEQDLNTLKEQKKFLDQYKPSTKAVPIEASSRLKAFTPGLVVKLEEKHKEKLSVLPELVAIGDLGIKGLKGCDDVQNLIQVWKELPAKKINPSALVKM